jgi:hypothetical protein
VLGDPAGPVDARLSFALMDRVHTEVELWGKAAVEAHLLVTQKPPLLGGAQIDEGVVYRPFDLVDESASQQHPGDVGLDEIDSPHRVRVGSRVE